MSKEKAPAFQFYPRDWLSDENVMSLSYEQEGWYIHLLCHCWLEGSIPADPAHALRLIGIRERDLAHLEECELSTRMNKRMEDMEELLKLCFSSASPELDRLVNPRLDRERKMQEERRKERAESGKRGGKARVNKLLSKPKLSLTLACNQLQANSSSSSSSSSSSNTPTVDTFLTVILKTGEEFPITNSKVKEWEDVYSPVLDVKQTLRRIKLYFINYPKKRKTPSGILKSVDSWLARDYEDAKNKQTLSNLKFGNAL